MIKKVFFGIVPAILLTLAVGSIYAFSLFVDPISIQMMISREKVQIAFSLGIFFLGMGAAFFGPLVEKNIKSSTILGTALFLIGLCITQYSINIKNILLLYIGYGGIVGTATGIIYISPVKTMMMWFKKNPGIASAISIISFGFGTSLCGLFYSHLYPISGINGIFFNLAIIYALMMVVGSILLKKPRIENVIINQKNNKVSFSKWNFIKTDSWGRRAWLFMFLNISAGLALIGCAASILKDVEYSQKAIVMIVSLMGISNTAGRFIFAWIGDFLKEKRINLWIVIPILSIVCFIPSIISIQYIVVPLLIIPALYGAGFSTCPSILANKYGMSNISTIHGLVLSAWGCAGLVGNQISTQLFKAVGNYSILPFLLIAIYLMITINSNIMRKDA